MSTPPTLAQYEVLRPYITERITNLVRGRLLEGLKFFSNGAMLPEYSRAEVKLALLLIKIANPSEYMSDDESRVLEGRQRLSASDKPPIPSDKANLRPLRKSSKNRV